MRSPRYRWEPCLVWKPWFIRNLVHFHTSVTYSVLGHIESQRHSLTLAVTALAEWDSFECAAITHNVTFWILLRFKFSLRCFFFFIIKFVVVSFFNYYFFVVFVCLSYSTYKYMINSYWNNQSVAVRTLLDLSSFHCFYASFVEWV